MANAIGQRVRRREDPRFLTGRGTYVDDLKIPGALHVTFVRSPWAHARIVSVDASEAAALDGVQAFSGADIDLPPNAPPPFIGVDPQMHRPVVASEKVRFAGEIVAVVLAETGERSADAAELVAVEYEPLPVVTDPREAARNEVLLYEGLGTNVCLQRPLEPDRELFDRSGPCAAPAGPRPARSWSARSTCSRLTCRSIRPRSGGGTSSLPMRSRSRRVRRQLRHRRLRPGAGARARRRRLRRAA